VARHRMRLGFLAYPWDLLDEGPRAALETMVDLCGCDALLLNANYHHARLLRPRASGPKTFQLPGAVAAFEPVPARYGSEDLTPVPHPRLARARILQQVRDACQDHEVDFGLWTVGLHNSTLGQRRSDLCVRNCFGDVYTYALCPAHSEVQAYFRGLVDDLCRQFRPQRLVVEAVGHLGLRHGIHHELFMAPWSEALEMLLSLCFCPACIERAGVAGVDNQRLRQQVARWASRLLAEERGQCPLDFSHGETAALLMDMPDLWSFLQRRAETVTRLVRDLYAVAQAQGVPLCVIPASFHRPASRAWLEGASLPHLAVACDELVIPAYFDAPAQVAADLSWATDYVGEPVVAALNAASPTLGDASALIGQALACQAAGCRAVYYYNYGLLTRRRLDWVAQANACVRQAESVAERGS
jgi:hypothetical protein